MKQFIIRLIVFFAIFFILDKCFIVVRNYSAGLEADKRLEKIITGQLHADILIFGSSRGARNVIAEQIQDSMGITAFNLSYPGSDIEFHNYLLQQVLKNDQKPKQIVLVVDWASELKEDPTIKFRYDRLYPLVKYESVRNTLIERGMKNKYLMHLFILHQMGVSNFLLYQKNFSPLDTVFSRGSMPVSFQSKKFSGVYDSTVKKYRITEELPQKVSAFTSFVELCNANNIKLILAFAPNYFPSPSESIERIKYFAGNKASLMFYDSTKKEYSDPSYYYDYAHLQKNGAIIFTNELISFLRKPEPHTIAMNPNSR